MAQLVMGVGGPIKSTSGGIIEIGNNNSGKKYWVKNIPSHPTAIFITFGLKVNTSPNTIVGSYPKFISTWSNVVDLRLHE